MGGWQASLLAAVATCAVNVCSFEEVYEAASVAGPSGLSLTPHVSTPMVHMMSLKAMGREGLHAVPGIDSKDNKEL